MRLTISMLVIVMLVMPSPCKRRSGRHEDQDGKHNGFSHIPKAYRGMALRKGVGVDSALSLRERLAQVAYHISDHCLCQ